MRDMAATVHFRFDIRHLARSLCSAQKLRRALQSTVGHKSTIASRQTAVGRSVQLRLAMSRKQHESCCSWAQDWYCCWQRAVVSTCKLRPILELGVDDAGRPPERSCSCCYLFSYVLSGKVRSWNEKKISESSTNSTKVCDVSIALISLVARAARV